MILVGHQTRGPNGNPAKGDRHVEFSVGTNWDPLLLEQLSAIPSVTDVYGCLARHVVGHGRPSSSVPEVSARAVEEHVAAAHKRGLTFSYLLNAPSMGGRQFGRRERKLIREHLDWVASFGADSVTVSLADLVELVVREYPSLKVKVSHNSMIRSVEQARMFEEMGASMITVHGSMIRDFVFLEKLVKSVGIPLQVICTANCVRGCPNRISYHSAATAVLSSNRVAPDRFNRHATGYCFSWCHLRKISQPEYIVMAGVRPEDLHYYREVGINHFKLDTRVMRTDQILDRAAAYASESWEGDLKRLLSVFPLGYKTNTGTQMGGGDVGTLAAPTDEEVERETPDDPAVKDYFSVAQKVDFDKMLSLDNKRLNGVMEPFFKGTCTGICGECSHCSDFATSMVWDEPSRLRLSGILKRYRDWMFTR